MLEVYCRSRKAARFDEENTRLDRALDPPYLDPPYKEMIAMAYNLRLLQDRKSGKKAKLTREELQEKIVEGDKGITRLWHRHMGTGFIRADARLVGKIQRLTDAGVEVAVLTHSFKHGEGEAMEKLEKLGLRGVISEHNIFGVEEIFPYRKGRNPEAFEKVLTAINSRRDPADPIKPIETIMAEDTIGNLEGAKKAGMQTVWVPRREKGMPNRPYVSYGKARIGRSYLRYAASISGRAGCCDPCFQRSPLRGRPGVTLWNVLISETALTYSATRDRGRAPRTGEPARPPVPVARKAKERRTDHNANERGVNQDGDRQGESDHLDHQETSEGECRKYHDHDRGCARNQACGPGQTLPGSHPFH